MAEGSVCGQCGGIVRPTGGRSRGGFGVGTGDDIAWQAHLQGGETHPSSALTIDQVVVHIDGDTAVVSARTSREDGRFARYVDTYARRAAGWLCVHACVWPLRT